MFKVELQQRDDNSSVVFRVRVRERVHGYFIDGEGDDKSYVFC